MESVHIEPINDVYIDDCLSLCNERPSFDDVDRSTILNCMNGTDGFVSSVALYGSDLIGFVLGHVNSFSNCIQIPYCHLPENINLSSRCDVGFISGVCVDGSHDNTFVYEKLLTDVIKQLEQFEVSVVYELATAENADLTELLSDFGFVCELNKYDKHASSHQLTSRNSQHDESENGYNLYIKYNTLSLGQIC